MIRPTRLVLIRDLDAESIGPCDLPERRELAAFEVLNERHGGECHDANADGALLAQTSGFVEENNFSGVNPRSKLRGRRSEEHTSELQSPCNLVCRLLLEKKKNNKTMHEPRQRST